MKKTFKYTVAALAVALTLTLLAACGEQSYTEGDSEFKSTEDLNGFESADASENSENEQDSETSDNNGNGESAESEEDTDGNEKETSGSGGTVDLPLFPI